MTPTLMQVQPPMLVETEDGKRCIHGIIDYGDDRPQKWVACEPGGSVWLYRSDQVRLPARAEHRPGEVAALRVDATAAGPAAPAGPSAVNRIVAWMAAFREARAGESRYSKAFHALATEAHGLLAELVAGTGVDAATHEKVLARAGLMADLLERFRLYFANSRRHAEGKSDAFAASFWNAQVGSWLSEIATLLDPPAGGEVSVLSRAG